MWFKSYLGYELPFIQSDNNHIYKPDFNMKEDFRGHRNLEVGAVNRWYRKQSMAIGHELTKKQAWKSFSDYDVAIKSKS